LFVVKFVESGADGALEVEGALLSKEELEAGLADTVAAPEHTERVSNHETLPRDACV
jgi:hypothetical protein